MFNAFRQVCMTIIMRWCNMQTNRYVLQAILYSIICTYHKQHSGNGNKHWDFPGSIYSNWKDKTRSGPSYVYNGKHTSKGFIMIQVPVNLCRNDTISISLYPIQNILILTWHSQHITLSLTEHSDLDSQHITLSHTEYTDLSTTQPAYRSIPHRI